MASDEWPFAKNALGKRVARRGQEKSRSLAALGMTATSKGDRNPRTGLPGEEPGRTHRERPATTEERGTRARCIVPLRERREPQDPPLHTPNPQGWGTRPLGRVISDQRAGGKREADPSGERVISDQ